ncbi:MAG: metal-dependent hydrolase, partial [Candidatus Hydrogenedentes bacterium]|nr:metal-dependent hydrolase [Candidatus Hydrogenedentota bacterium]
VWGGIAGIIPDLDIAVIPFLGRMGEQLYHRGPTHAFWFGPLFGALMGYAIWRWYGARPPRQLRADLPAPGGDGMLRAWIGLCVLAIFTHPLLDMFTTYGTQFLWPFSKERIAWDAIAIIDPVYSLLLLAALLAGALLRRRLRLARWLAAVALVLTTTYLFFGLYLNEQAKALARTQLADETAGVTRIESYPTLFQVFLRRVVVRSETTLRVGYVSMLYPQRIAWSEYALPEGRLVERLSATDQGRVFTWFAKEQVAATVTANGAGTVVTLDDVRYGFPGPAEFGMWGIRGRFSEQGDLIGPVEYFDRRPERPVRELLAELWRDAFVPRNAKG